MLVCTAIVCLFSLTAYVSDYSCPLSYCETAVINIKVFHFFSSWKGFYIPGKERERQIGQAEREKRE